MKLTYRVCVCGKTFPTSRPHLIRWCTNKCRLLHSGHSQSRVIAARQRRAREALALGSHTEAEWQIRLQQHGRYCHYCYKELIGVDTTRDHIIPLSRGGSDNIDNLVPCCHRCNSRKKSMTATEYKKKLDDLNTKAVTVGPFEKWKKTKDAEVSLTPSQLYENFDIVEKQARGGGRVMKLTNTRRQSEVRTRNPQAVCTVEEIS